MLRIGPGFNDDRRDEARRSRKREGSVHDLRKQGHPECPAQEEMMDDNV